MISLAAIFVLLCQSQPAPSERPVVHLIVNADTEAKDIGPEMVQNLSLIENSFQQNLGGALRLHAEHRGCTIESIEASIKNVNVRSQDALVFYYGGHGGFDQRYGAFISPSLDKGRYKLRKDLAAKLLSKKARLTVMISDSCNNVKTHEGLIPSPQAPNRDPAFYTPLFRKLFYESEGFYELSSSKKGEYSLCSPRKVIGNVNGQKILSPGRGLFTKALSDRLLDGERMTTWDGLAVEVGVPVAAEFKLLFPSGLLAHEADNTPPQRTQTVVGSGKIVYRDLSDSDKLPLKSEIIPNNLHVVAPGSLPLR